MISRVALKMASIFVKNTLLCLRKDAGQEMVSYGLQSNNFCNKIVESTRGGRLGIELALEFVVLDFD